MRSRRNQNTKTSSSRRVWGYWDCQICGTKKIIGKTKDCPNCGSGAPGPDAFYLDTSKGRDAEGRFVGLEEAKEPEFQEKLGKGADWICPSCSTGNWRVDVQCRMCGQSRTEEVQPEEIPQSTGPHRRAPILVDEDASNPFGDGSVPKFVLVPSALAGIVFSVGFVLVMGIPTRRYP